METVPQGAGACPAASEEGLSARDLFPMVYDQLRALACCQLREERPDHTLQPTALVHEAFLRLARERRSRWRNPDHFLAVAAEVARRILVDHARSRCAAKRGGGGGDGNRARSAGPAEAIADARPCWCVEMLALDDALAQLWSLHERRARVASLRVFGGMTGEQIAAALDVSRATVASDWSVARAWLTRELKGGRRAWASGAGSAA